MELEGTKVGTKFTWIPTHSGTKSMGNVSHYSQNACNFPCYRYFNILLVQKTTKRYKMRLLSSTAYQILHSEGTNKNTTFFFMLSGANQCNMGRKKKNRITQSSKTLCQIIWLVGLLVGWFVGWLGFFLRKHSSSVCNASTSALIIFYKRTVCLNVYPWYFNK